MNGQQLSYKQAIIWGISTFFNNLGIFAKFLLLWIVVYGLIGACVAAIGLTIYGLCYAFMGGAAATALLTNKIVLVVGGIVAGLIAFYVMNCYWASLISLCFKLYRHEPVSISSKTTLLSAQQNNHFFKVMALWTLSLFVAFFLFIIPGILLFLYTCFIDLLTVDKNLSFKESFSVNKKLIFGHKVSYFFFTALAGAISYLVTFLISKFFALVGLPSILSSIIDGALRYTVMAIILLARTFLYEQLASNQEYLHESSPLK